jgi:hypothetical protein
MSGLTQEQRKAAGIPYVTHGFVGRKPCGCITAACIDNTEDPKTTLEDVREFLGLGLALQRVPIWEAVIAGDCPHGAP